MTVHVSFVASGVGCLLTYALADSVSAIYTNFFVGVGGGGQYSVNWTKLTSCQPARAIYAAPVTYKLIHMHEGMMMSKDKAYSSSPWPVFHRASSVSRLKKLESMNTYDVNT